MPSNSTGLNTSNLMELNPLQLLERGKKMPVNAKWLNFVLLFCVVI